ncbi:MAG: Holliday junction resolvase RuvX [Tenericutes bacterium]|nr:Holliday junction resolvase RuvX [Mycoplasmatota bacterium]
MIYLGLDLGSKTLGISISDRTSTIATSLDVIRYKDYDDLLESLSKIVIERKVDSFVLGNPINLDGSLSKRSEETFKFKKLLEEKFSKDVYMQDERLSTVEAERILISNDTKRKNRKKVIDKVAATIILQGYLDRSNNEK